MFDDVISNMRNYASINNIPIMTDDGIEFLMDYIKTNNVKKVLEIGTAIGYSAIRICSISDDIIVTTVERDEDRYLEALKNVKDACLEDRINMIFKDALEVTLDDKYDLIFIDAAKAQNRKFFERFENNLSETGTIITDNMKFHGLVDTKMEDIQSRNLRQLVRKVRDYTKFLEENENYVTEFYDIGDGVAVSKRV